VLADLLEIDYTHHLAFKDGSYDHTRPELYRRKGNRPGTTGLYAKDENFGTIWMMPRIKPNSVQGNRPGAKVHRKRSGRR
jgi:hypothetical protein